MDEDLKRINVDLGAPVMIDTSKSDAMEKRPLDISESEMRERLICGRPEIIEG